MKKTLGGQRLGSGNKMQVDLHGFERSTQDLSYIWRSTMASGTLVPFLKEVALPGDTFDIKLNLNVKTHPTVGPLFGSYKAQIDVFQIPMRLYHSALHNNKLGIGMKMNTIKIPKYEMWPTAPDQNNDDIDNAQINPSSILSYLGHRGVGTINGEEIGDVSTIRYFNAIPLLAYWDIYKNYYANKQEEWGVVIAKPLTPILTTVTSITSAGDTIPGAGGSSVVNITGPELIQVFYTGTAPSPDTILVQFWGGDVISFTDLVYNVTNDTVGGNLNGTYNFQKWGSKQARYWRYITTTEILNEKPYLQPFPLSDIDKMRETILASPATLEFNVTQAAAAGGITPYNYLFRSLSTSGDIKYWSYLSGQEGLGIKTYQSDKFNNWLSTEWLDGAGGINEITAVDTTAGSFNVEALILAKKVYDMLNRIAVSGGSYNDWLEAVYDHPQSMRAESPVYMGGLIKELVFQEVVSNSQSAEQPLGTLAGKGVMADKHKGGTVVIRVDEPSYIMGIVSLTPRVDYSQGNKWDINLDTLDDLHKPNLDQIGFQELITEQMHWASTYKVTGVVGWQTNSAGKQPAWINYMTNVNEVRGNFAIANNEMFMVLNRRYEIEATSPETWAISDLTTYIDPSKFNHIFAETAIDAQNFWTQISIDMTARRKMSAKVMPNL